MVCAAPLARRAHDLAAHLTASGWDVTATTSVNAISWVDTGALAAVSRAVADRSPGTPRPRPASAVVLAPGTFNTLNKLRSGISDTPALGVLNDAIGQQLPLLVIPMISERLIDHPAWAETTTWLSHLNVTFLDPSTGRTGAIGPLRSGTGEEVTARFSPAWVTGWANGLPAAAR
ncbi:flavoprotein [Friedmanniella luteola]|uniref:flavoprotein n=1 Tax=Friedmanniella luteola TaxID=546871 RepID=UPI003CC967EF